MRQLSILVPVYNSEHSLPFLVEEIQTYIGQSFERYELIFINDDSKDSSWTVIEALVQKHDWIRGINLMRNYGQHNAILCGLREARYEYTLTIDDDLQHPIEAITDLVAALDTGCDVVYASPGQLQHGLLRNLASQITKLALQGSMGQENASKISAYRLFRTNLRDAFADYRGPFVSIDVLLTWATTRFTYRTVEHRPRPYGQSNYTIARLITHALNMVTGFSVLPLQVASIIGVALAGFSFLVLTYVIIRTLIDGIAVQGFAFTASLIGIVSGGQLLALGIIGEYMARMYFRVIDKPSYVVRHTATHHQEEG